MVASIARIIVAAIAALGLLHIYWALGGRTGQSVAVPEVNGQRAFTPSRSGTLAVAGALLFASAVVAIAGGIVRVGGYAAFFRIMAFGLSLTFLARAIGDFRLVGFFKRIHGTRFARLDTVVFSPCCLVLGLAIFYVAYNDV